MNKAFSDSEAMADNPYTQLERGWTDQLQKAQRRNTAAMGANVLLTIALVSSVFLNFYLALFREPVPYVLELDSHKRVNFGGYLTQSSPLKDEYIPSQLINFVESWRTVTPDNTMQKKLATRLYCMLPSNSASITKMNEYFRDKKNNPFEINTQYSVATEIKSILRQTGQTWAVEWRETIRTLDGKIDSEPKLYKVLMVLSKAKPGQECMEGNPLGLYVSQLNWTTVL